MYTSFSFLILMRFGMEICFLERMRTAPTSLQKKRWDESLTQSVGEYCHHYEGTVSSYGGGGATIALQQLSATAAATTNLSAGTTCQDQEE